MMMMMIRHSRKQCESKPRPQAEKAGRGGIVFTFLRLHPSPTLFHSMTSSILELECPSLYTPRKVPECKFFVCFYTLHHLQERSRKWLLIGYWMNKQNKTMNQSLSFISKQGLYSLLLPNKSVLPLSYTA